MMLMIFSTLAVSAQRKISDNSDSQKEWKSDYTPEQRATLKAKKMTLELDLNAAQQKKIEQVFLQSAKKQKNKSDWKNMTPEQKFSLKNEMLDRRIENKSKIKEILTAEQYEKWDMHQSRTNGHRSNKNQGRHNRKQ